MYKCDKCNKKTSPSQDDIMIMLYYVSPHGCMGGDYYTVDHYFFYCECRRPIEVREDDVEFRKDRKEIEKMHGWGRCTSNVVRQERRI